VIPWAAKQDNTGSFHLMDLVHEDFFKPCSLGFWP
jgi:hypothetical protein